MVALAYGRASMLGMVPGAYCVKLQYSMKVLYDGGMTGFIDTN